MAMMGSLGSMMKGPVAMKKMKKMPAATSVGPGMKNPVAAQGAKKIRKPRAAKSPTVGQAYDRKYGKMR